MIKRLLSSLHRNKRMLEEDIMEENTGKYPPLYSMDYMHGRLRAINEVLQIMEADNE